MDENRPILLKHTIRKRRPVLLTGIVPIGWAQPVVEQAVLRASSAKLLREPHRVRDEIGRAGGQGRGRGRGRAQAQGRSTVAPVVSLASSARWASAASESG